jgi:dolichol-phosphate mannosyltransferase
MMIVLFTSSPLMPMASASISFALSTNSVSGTFRGCAPRNRRAVSRAGNLYAALLLGTRVKDATSGYRAYTSDTLKSIDYSTTRAKGYGFQIEARYRVHVWGGRIVEVPIVFTDRMRGYLRMTWFIFAE